MDASQEPGRPVEAAGRGDAVEAAICGGKAAGLARLLRAGFAVPAGVCLTTEVYRSTLARAGIFAETEALAAESPPDPRGLPKRLAHIREVIETASVSAEVNDAIRCGLASFGSDRAAPLAVRSSAALEDQAYASHAGVHATFVGEYDIDAVVDSPLVRRRSNARSSLTERQQRRFCWRHGAGADHSRASCPLPA